MSATTSGGGADSTGGGAAGAEGSECSLCQHPAEADRLDLYYLDGETCIVLEMAGGDFGAQTDKCDGLNVGAGDWCLTEANLWFSATECPPPDAGPPVTALSAEGYVVGHDGVLSVGVELTFPSGTDQIVLSVYTSECAGFESLAWPCSWE